MSKPLPDKFDEAAAKHHLFAEKIGLAFFPERRFDQAGAAAADRRPIGKSEVMRVAGRVARDRDETRHAATALVFRPHGMARPFRRDHQDVEIAARFNEVKMNIQTMRKHQRGALLQIRAEMIAIDVALQFVGRQHRHDIGPFGGVGDALHFEPDGRRLLGRG